MGTRLAPIDLAFLSLIPQEAQYRYREGQAYGDALGDVTKSLMAGVGMAVDRREKQKDRDERTALKNIEQKRYDKTREDKAIDDWRDAMRDFAKLEQRNVDTLDQRLSSADFMETSARDQLSGLDPAAPDYQAKAQQIQDLLKQAGEQKSQVAAERGKHAGLLEQATNQLLRGTSRKSLGLRGDDVDQLVGGLGPMLDAMTGGARTVPQAGSPGSGGNTSPRPTYKDIDPNCAGEG